MGSPFKKFVNLEIYYDVDSGESQDDEYGISRSSGKVTKTVKASVDQDAKDPLGKATIGADIDAVFITGNLVSPKLIPSDFPVSKALKAKFIDPATKNEYRGEFELEVFAPVRFKAVSKALGTPIRGYFTLVGGG